MILSRKCKRYIQRCSSKYAVSQEIKKMRAKHPQANVEGVTDRVRRNNQKRIERRAQEGAEALAVRKAAEKHEKSLLRQSHSDEMAASGISNAVAALNFRSIDDSEELESLMLSAALEAAADKTGTYIKAEGRRLRERHKSSFKDGGWYCAGQDTAAIAEAAKEFGALSELGDDEWQAITNGLIDLPTSSWGCFKPDAPRITEYKKDKNGCYQKIAPKTVKYEHPAKTATQAFLLSKPGAPRIWLEVLANVEQDIIITEGAKKAACLIGMGYIAIAVPGVFQWNKPKTRELITELAIFARKDRRFYIAFDQDTKAKTRSDVARQICKLCSALRAAGAKAFVIEWSPLDGKGVDDFCVANGKAAFDGAIALARQFEYWALKYLSRMTYPIAYNVPAGQRYIDGEHGTNEPKIPFDFDHSFYALIAPKGTGKTEAIRRMIGIALQNGQRVLLVTHRVQLTQALCDRTGIPSVYEILRNEADESQGYGLCIQSLHPKSQAQFTAETWADALIVIDECEQVLQEVLNSSTCKSNRVAILQDLRTIISNALCPETDGKLCIADADLSNISIDLLRGLAGESAPSPWICRSEYKGDETSSQVAVFEKNEQLLEATESRIAMGEKVLCITDSQRSKSRFGSLALAERWGKRFPQLKILRVDSETLNREDSSAYGAIAQLNNLAASYDIVICSPSVETGVSLDLCGHFSRVVGFYQGVLSENSVRQSLARLRDNVPRDIVLPTRGLSFIGGEELSADNLEASQSKQIKATLNMLFEAARLDGIDSNFLPPALHGWSAFAARQNAGMATFRDIVVSGLREEGHTVNLVEQPLKNTPEREALAELSNQLSDEKHTRVKAEADDVVAANDLTDSQVARLEKANSVANRDEQLQLRKAVLKKMYPGHEITPDLYILHQHDYYKSIRLHYALTQGREFIKDNDREKVEALLEGTGGALWANDVLRSTLSLKVSLLDAFKVLALTKKTEIHHSDPDVLALAQIAYDYRAHVKTICGFSISQKELAKPVSIAKKFLGLIGFGTGTARKVKAGGRVTRFYPVEQIDYKTLGGYVDGEYDPKGFRYSCDRGSVFAAWLTKDFKSNEERKEKAEATVEQQVQSGTTSNHGDNLGNRSYIHIEVVPVNAEVNYSRITPQDKPQDSPARGDRQIAPSAVAFYHSERATRATRRAAVVLEPAHFDTSTVSDDDWNGDAWAKHPATRAAS